MRKKLNKNIGYYFITDNKLSLNGTINDVKNACIAGVKIIQYRNKSESIDKQYHEAHKLRQICKNYDVIFLINDRVDIALAVDADGVHLGQDDLPYPVARKLLGKNKIIGVSTHNVQEAKIAEFSNADYIGVGAMFETSTKKVEISGIETLKKIRAVVDLPIVAIGGINFKNMDQVIEAKADGLASISAVLTKEDVISTIEEINQKFSDCRILH